MMFDLRRYFILVKVVSENDQGMHFPIKIVTFKDCSCAFYNFWLPG